MNIKKLKAASGDKSQCSGFLHFDSYILFDDVKNWMFVDVTFNVDEVKPVFPKLLKFMDQKRKETFLADHKIS